MKKACVFAVCSFLLVLCSGCAVLLVGAAATGAGAAGVAYAKGDLEAVVDADPQTVMMAAEGAFETLFIKKVSTSSTAFDADIVGRTATDKKVKVRAEGAGKGASTVSVRVGTFGDEALSRKVYEEIKLRLPAPAPPGI